MKIQITLPINGTVETIAVSLRVWLGMKIFTLAEWLVSPTYVADVNLVEKFTAE